MSVRDELDKLLNFYDEHKPAMKGQAVGVYLAPGSVEKFAKKDDAGVYWYRGFKINPLNKPKKH